MYEGPEFRHLLSFLAVVEECNFGKAARKLHISQPSLSAHIKQLEDGLGASLFMRSRAGAGLTPSGRKFLPFARRMLQMRTQSVRATSSRHSGAELPFCFGYSPFVNHEFVADALTGYRELAPEGRIELSSDCTDALVRMIREGHLEAALVSLPVDSKDLFVHKICEEKVLVCLRRDDPLAIADSLPREAIADRLRIIFARTHHPLFYDKLMRKFAKVGIVLHPSEFVSAPSEMQFLVKMGYGFGLVRESTPIAPELTTRSVAGLNLRITTAFVCHPAEQRPVLQLLAHRISKRCADSIDSNGLKRPNERASSDEYEPLRKAG